MVSMQARYELWAGLLQNAVIQLGRCVYTYVFILKIDMDLKKCMLEMRPLWLLRTAATRVGEPKRYF